MKEYITEFLKLLVKCVLVICFAFGAFLLISNFYHYREVSYTYTPDFSKTSEYGKYKSILARVDKKMKSVDYSDVKYATTAKPIFEYYSGCIKTLNETAFAKFSSMSSIKYVDVYNANNDILKKVNGRCTFYIPYNISQMVKDGKSSVSFDSTLNLTTVKNDIIIDNAEYLIDSSLGNSSYSVVTDMTRSTIYNKLANEYQLTVNNYTMIALLLEDVADWYVLEYGGNN